MKRDYKYIILVIALALLICAGCGMPKKTLTTVSNAGFVKVIVNPEDADVYIDGTKVGKAMDFDGRKHILELTSGRHKIEIKKEGYHSTGREMMVGAGATEEYKATLIKQ